MQEEDVKRGRGIYLLPNLFTIMALFAGFFAIVSAMKGHFDVSAIALFVAMIMDTLDGRVARLTNTQTSFGAELDSLSDMVCFGIAPALIMYIWALDGLGKLGWLTAFIYAVAVALRLARFNVAGSLDKRFFRGLPCPSAAAVLASLLWVGTDYQIQGHGISYWVVVTTLLVAILMVSNVRYRSFKDLDVKGKVPFIVILLIVGAIVLVSIDPPQVLLFISGLYVVSGPITYVWKNKHKALSLMRRSKKNK